MHDHERTLFGDELESDSGARSNAGLGSDEPVNPLNLERGTSIGRYVVVEKLGQGGMGVVYAAYDPQLDRKIAFKLLHAQPSARDSAAIAEKQDRLLREAQALARVAHANVIAVHDVGNFQGHIFVAMEYLQGEDLKAWAPKQTHWRVVLEAYRKAGRGLQAAHEAGLVHRDFKPENAFRCEDGRVKVLDFGLAFLSDPESLRSAQDGIKPLPVERIAEAASRMGSTAAAPPGAGPKHSSDALATRSGEHSHASLSIRMTKPGALLGTPAFMAPEQWEGAEADARSDQFSFCAALYEGLYGERPFAGESINAIAFNISQGKVRDAPASTGVPHWLRQVLLRGLELEPDRRWPSMSTLLAELGRDRTAPRRRMIVAMCALLIGAGAWFVYERDDRLQRAECVAQGEVIGQSWRAPRRAAISAAFEATDLPYAEHSAQRVTLALDAYARGWTDQRTEVCLASSVRADQSAKVTALRVTCLEQARAEFDAVATLFEQADAKVVEHATEAVEHLANLAACADTEALLSALPPPQDEATAAAVTEVRQAIAKARSTRNAGKPKEALALGEAAYQRALRVDYLPLHAEALLHRGQLQHTLGNYDEAQADMTEALWLATANKHDQIALNAATTLVGLLGHDRADSEAGMAWARHARALLTRTGDNEVDRAAYFNSLGSLSLAKEDLAAARGNYEQVLAIREARSDTAPSDLGGILGNLGTVSTQLRDFQTGRQYFDRALTIYKEAYGPKHPSTARALNNLGVALEHLEDYKGALAHQSEALEIKRALLGKDHPSVGGSLGNMANVYARMKDYASALKLYTEALAIFEAALGPDHPHVGRCHDGVAEAQLELGHYEEAIRHSKRAVAIFEASDNTARNLAQSQFALAKALGAAGRDRDEADRLARAAKGYLTSLDDPDDDTKDRLKQIATWLGEDPSD